GARVEERQAYLQQVEDELKGRLNETRHVGENLAAEKVALRAEQARLLAERAAVEQDRRQCNEVAHGFVERERRLKEAEKKLSQVKDDLAAYEAFLRARGSDGA
ncbi:hypothetical protein DQ04_05911000, partial [Trypanosoma grayi]|uniref:hypothetical protein n=1 Tax=Trypanosoma grayi TaxID=71804 RepID=UPI0004F48D60